MPDRRKLKELRDEVGSWRSDYPISQFQISGFAVASLMWAEDFTDRLCRTSSSGWPGRRHVRRLVPRRPGEGGALEVKIWGDGSRRNFMLDNNFSPSYTDFVKQDRLNSQPSIVR